MAQLTAVAYAAMEEEFVDGTREARAKFQGLFVAAGVDPGADDGNPFGPDPAIAASMTGQPDHTPFRMPLTADGR